MAEARTATGRRISYDIAGDGPALMLLMAAGESRQMWADQVAALSAAFRVITLDNRDTGASLPEAEPYTIANLAGDAAALLDTLGLERPHIVGTSMGGMIALQMALDHPERVDRLVLLSTPAGGMQLAAPPREAWPADHADWIRYLFPMLAAPGYFDANPAALEALAERGRENELTYEGAVRQIDAVNAFGVRDRLAEIASPTLLVVGDHDPFIPLAEAHAFASALPDCRLVVVERAGHLVFVERPDEVNRTVLDFLGVK